MTTPAELQGQITKSNERYFRAAEGIESELLETEQICGHWSARDVTLHLADWGDWILVGVEYALSGETSDDYPMKDVDSFNDSQAESYGDVSWAEASARLAAVNARAAELAGSLSEDQLEIEAVAPWDESTTVGVLLDGFQDHQDEHVVDLEAFAAVRSA